MSGTANKGYTITYTCDGAVLLNGEHIPAGTISCGVLNISKEAVAEMDAAAQAAGAGLRPLISRLECVKAACGEPPIGEEAGILDDIVCFRVYMRRFLNKYLTDEKNGASAYERFRTDIDGLTAQLRRGDALRRTVFPRELKPVMTVEVEDGTVCEKYVFPTMCQLLIFDQLRALGQNKAARRCANCGRYFIPDRRNAGYCEQPAPGDPSRTCREVGARNAFARKHEDSEVYRLYASACGRIYTRKNRGTITAEDAADILNKCALLRDRAECGDIPTEELARALDELTASRRESRRS